MTHAQIARFSTRKLRRDWLINRINDMNEELEICPKSITYVFNAEKSFLKLQLDATNTLLRQGG